MEFLDFTRLVFDDAAAVDTAATGAQTNYFLVLFKVVIAVYLFVMAIRGKGKLMDNEFPKCSPEKYKLIMRLLCAFAGLVVLANGVVEFLASSAYSNVLPLSAEGYSTLATVLWAIGLVGLVSIIVVNIVLTDRKAMEEARQKQEAERRTSSGGSTGNDPLRAAFVFDEDEVNAGEFKRKSDENDSDRAGE